MWSCTKVLESVLVQQEFFLGLYVPLGFHKYIETFFFILTHQLIYLRRNVNISEQMKLKKINLYQNFKPSLQRETLQNPHVKLVVFAAAKSDAAPQAKHRHSERKPERTCLQHVFYLLKSLKSCLHAEIQNLWKLRTAKTNISLQSKQTSLSFELEKLIRLIVFTSMYENTG